MYGSSTPKEWSHVSGACYLPGAVGGISKKEALNLYMKDGMTASVINVKF